jgi:hypothetical protein
METAKKPAPRPVKSEKKSDGKPAETEAVASTDIVTPAEIAECTETVAPLPEAPASEPAAEVSASAETATAPVPEVPAA